MAGARANRLRSLDALKTYRYLRIGMIGAVALLAASIAIERSKVDCFQTSISAYYYTPVRAIFVACMFAVSLSLIAYKGRTTGEDLFLNLAGMAAPIVAVAPTIDIGTCWSAPPFPRPDTHGTLANWVINNIDNNFYALLIAGAVAFVVALVILILNLRLGRDEVGVGTVVLVAATAVILLLGWWAIENWDSFNRRAHGIAAVAMFAFLVAAIVANVVTHKDERGTPWTAMYSSVAALMVLGGVVALLGHPFGRHEVFALEAWEIGWFAAYWLAQTVENWNERVLARPGPEADAVELAATPNGTEG